MSILIGSVTLPSDLFWTDEFDFSTIVAEKGRTITGALEVQQSTRALGRPITLESTEKTGWCTRQQILDLQTLVDAINTTYVLNLNGTLFNVRFDHEAGALEAKALFEVCRPVPVGHYYLVTIRLYTV